MGRIYIFRKLILGCALLIAFSMVFPKLTMPQANAASAQTIPAISINTSGARDANTFESDKALDAACRKSGQDNAVCLCLTHVMKYEMSLKTYRAATRLYGQAGDRSALHRKLYSEGYQKPDIETAENMERNLVASDDFGLRCAEAKSYYRNAAK